MLWSTSGSDLTVQQPPEYPFPEEWVRQAARTSNARAPRDPSTTQRQLAAGRAHRYPDLATIRVPTLVISGGATTPSSGGERQRL